MIQRVVRGPDRRKPGRVTRALRISGVFLVLIVGGFLGWSVSDYQAQIRYKQFASVVESLDSISARAAGLERDQVRLTRQAQVDRAAFDALQEQVSELMQIELGLRRQVGIYQELMSIAHGEITIHRFSATAIVGGGYAYQLVIAQGMGANEAVSGTVFLHDPAGALLAESPFAFRHLQFIDGHIELSVADAPDTILLRVKLKSGSVVEQTVAWPGGRLVGRQIDVE